MKNLVLFLGVVILSACEPSVDAGVMDAGALPIEEVVVDNTPEFLGGIGGDLGVVGEFAVEAYKVTHDDNDYYESFTNFGQLPDRVVMSRISFIAVRPNDLAVGIHTFNDAEVSVAACYGFQQGNWSYDQNAWDGIEVEITEDGDIKYSAEYTLTNGTGTDFVVGIVRRD